MGINKKKIIIPAAVVIALLVVILIIVLANRKIDVSDATHSITITENAVFYKKAELENVKIYKTLSIGTEIYVLDEFEDSDGNEWSEVVIDNKKGYILSSEIGRYINSGGEKSLMVDVSKFNQIYNFETADEFGVFLVENNIDYVYIRAGGRGYGDEGNFYEDETASMWADKCEYLGIQFGFYFLDEALDSDEIDEEVDFIVEFLEENQYEYNTLPVAIDVEKHDGNGRADDIWDVRSKLVSKLLKRLSNKDIETIVYSNALVASEYLSDLNTEFWIAYYPELDGEIPDYWYDETDQAAAENDELLVKVIAWQFTDSGVEGVINESVDLSLVLKDAF